MGILAALSAACANIGQPPGGPLRDVPPELLRVTPESGAVNVRADRVTFEFDVVVSDKPIGQPALEDMFVVSPREGEGTPRVRWRRDRIEVRPRRPFRPNTAYSVTMLPGIADLRNNVLREGRTIVFSTGPTIPSFAIRGRAFDWMTGRVAQRARLEIVRQSDSLPYIGIADSAGQFAVGPLPGGAYTARAFLDANNNRERDPTEAWDTVSVSVQGTVPFIELLLAPRDTIAPRVLTVSAPDSLTLQLSFDRALDPNMPLTPEGFRVVAADSTPLRIAQATAGARRDTTRTAAAADSVAPADTTQRARADSALAATPRPSRPAPPRDVTLVLDSLTPMRRGTAYRVTALAPRGLLGASRSSERVVTFERAPADSAGARPRP